MSTQHARDDWDTTPGDGEVLARALQAMAEDVGGAPADDARGGLPARVGTVRARVRRRRAVKKTALGAATLGVIAVLAVGATQLPAWETSEPLPADPPTDLAAMCGTTVDLDPEPDASLPYAMRLDGDAQVRPDDSWEGVLRVEDATERVDEAVGLTDVRLVATRGLEVVGVPAGPVTLSQGNAAVNGSSGPTVEARFLACGTGEPLVPGAYDVYAEATLLPGTGDLSVVAGPVSLEVVGEAPRAEPGYQPPWLEGTPVSCGMEADDLAALADPDLTLTTHGLGAEVPGVVDTSFTNTGAARLSGVVAAVGPVAWVRDGVVVAVGPNALESPLELELAPDQVLALGAQAVPTDYCSPDDDGLFTTPVPPGDYDLVPYQGVLTDSGADYAAWAVGASVAVTLDADGTITPRG